MLRCRQSSLAAIVDGWMGNGPSSFSTWSEFVNMLRYKSEWRGRNLLFIGRFDPSSKMCSRCGHIKQDLQLKNRVWKWGGGDAPPPRGGNRGEKKFSIGGL